MFSFEEADEFLLISKGYDTQDLGLVVFTIKRLEKIIRIHFVKDTISSKSTFGHLVKFCDLDRGMKASLFFLADIRNDFVHNIGRYSFSSDSKRNIFIDKANDLIRKCAKRVNKAALVREGFRPYSEPRITFECLSEEQFRDFYELLRSFPELQEKVDRDEDDLYKDILHPVVKVENKSGMSVLWGVFGIVFLIVFAASFWVSVRPKFDKDKIRD